MTVFTLKVTRQLELREVSERELRLNYKVKEKNPVKKSLRANAVCYSLMHIIQAKYLIRLITRCSSVCLTGCKCSPLALLL